MRRRVLILICVAALFLWAAPIAAAVSDISVTDMSPDVGGRGSTVTCTVDGWFYHPLNALNFAPHFTLSRGLYTINGTTLGIENTLGSEAYVRFTIPGNAPLGWYDLDAQQTSGLIDSTDFLLNAFYVDQGPIIDEIYPSSLQVGAGNTGITIYGDYFVQASPGTHQSLVFVNGHQVQTVYWSSTKLGATVPAVYLASPGVLQVTVVNPGVVVYEDIWSNSFPLPVTAPPVLTAMSPTRATPGGPAFTLDLTGTGFLTGPYGAVVWWNSTPLFTTRDSSTHLRASVPASLIASAGSATVKVQNGGYGAPLSNGLTFTIAAPTPVPSSLSPSSVWAGYVKNDVVLTVTGTNFFSGAHIALNGVDKTNTTYVSPTQLTVPLTAADMATAGTVQVSVKNPPFPPGYASASSLPLTVAAETTTPQVSIGGADANWHNAAVLLSFAASDSQSGVQKVQYMSAPAVPSWTDGTSYTVPTTTQGAITVNVQALDWCNKAGTATATVYIDTTRPATRTLDDATVKKGGNARLKFRVEEPSNLSPKSAVVIKILRSDGSQAKKLEYPSVPMNKDRVAGFTCNLKKGTYKWYVYATDLAGNTQANVAKAKLTVN